MLISGMKKKIVYGLVVLLVLYGGLQIIRSFFGVSMQRMPSVSHTGPAGYSDIQADEAAPYAPALGQSGVNEKIVQGMPQRGIVPPPDQNPPVGTDEVEERLVIRNGSIRAVVEDVRSARSEIKTKVEQAGGFIVDARLTQPETAPHLSMSVRVPAENLDEVMELVRTQAERVTFESVTAQDVTAEYVDEQARLRSLEETREQMSEIMQQAQEISDLLNIQRQMQQIDEQIEQTKGRMEYLQKSAKLSLLNIELAQSEFELSVAPTEKWRPGFVFKQAVRNLLSFLQDLSYLAIRLAVYAVIWVPAGIIILLIYRRFRGKPNSSQTPG